MINFNLPDFNLNKIRVDSKIFNLLTKNNYNIYGLSKISSNNPFDIAYDSSKVSLPNPEVLVKLFGDNGIKVDLDKQDLESRADIFIGIRRDVRENIILSGMLLQIIIYYFEGRLNLDPSYRFPSIPSFCQRIEKKEKEEEKHL